MFARSRKVAHSDSEDSYSSDDSNGYSSESDVERGTSLQLSDLDTMDWLGLEKQEGGEVSDDVRERKERRRRRPVLSDSESDSDDGYDDNYDSRDEVDSLDRSLSPEPRKRKGRKEVSEPESESEDERSSQADSYSGFSSDPWSSDESGSEREEETKSSSPVVEKKHGDRKRRDRSESESQSDGESASDFFDSDDEARSSRRSNDDRSVSESESESEPESQSDSESGSDVYDSDESENEQDDQKSVSEVELPRDSFVSRSVSGESLFTNDTLNEQLKKKGYERFEFDVYAFMLYMNDLAAFLYQEENVERVAFRLARYINSVSKGSKNPMGDDVETISRAVNGFADIIGEFQDLPTVEKVRRLGVRIDGEGKKGERPSTYALSYAIPLVLSSLESNHPDVCAITKVVYPLVSLSESSSGKKLPYPLSQEGDVSALFSKLEDDDEAGALKMYQAFRSRSNGDEVLPIALSMDVPVFETRLRESVGEKLLSQVTHSIPIEGPDLASSYSSNVHELCDPTSETFVRGQPFAVTLDDQPNSETAFYHLNGQDE